MWNELLSREYLGNSIELYLKALAVVLAGLLILLIAGRILKKRIEKLEQRQQRDEASVRSRSLPFLKLFHRIVLPLIFLGVLGTATSFLDFDSQVRKIVSGVFATIMTIVIIRSINRAIDISLSRYFEKEREHNEDHEKNLRPLLSLIKFVFWVVGFIFLLANLGFDVSTAVAGLGVSGIAVAIAAQGILGDLFSYFVIFFDKPFELGDFIIFGDKLGVVEKIGIKSSRIRTLSGELLIISNSDLVSARIHNYKQMKRRRVVFNIGVTYQTSQEHVEEIPGIIRSVIESVTAVEGVICDRTHFKAFGDFSLNFETVYYVPTPDYNIYMDVQQEINRNIYRIFNEKGIEFAYPTQMIHFPEGLQLPNIAFETVPNNTAETDS
jgi:small-conductance mechanosensitive channel